MPVKIPETLPAKGVLESENIFVMGEQRAIHQDIRPLKIAILNLMPTKVETETQLCGSSAIPPCRSILSCYTRLPMNQRILPPNTC